MNGKKAVGFRHTTATSLAVVLGVIVALFFLRPTPSKTAASTALRPKAALLRQPERPDNGSTSTAARAKPPETSATGSAAPLAQVDISNLNARQLLERTFRVYSEAETYFDAGVLTTAYPEGTPDRIREQPFRTVFARNDRYRYEIWNGSGGDPSPYIIWSDGRETLTWAQDRNPRVRSTTPALAGIGPGFSLGGVPGLLFPGEIREIQMLQLNGVSRGGDEIIDGLDCIRLDGQWGANNTPRTIWVEKETGLVRKIAGQLSIFRYTVTYQPVLNKPIPSELLQFDPPPGKK